MVQMATVDIREIVQRIGAIWPLEPVGPAYRGEVASRYRYRDGRGEIGLISSVTEPFCRDCHRARLSADGKLYTCLFASLGWDVLGALRAGADFTAICETLCEWIEADHAAPRAAGLLKSWIAEGLLRDVQLSR